MPYLAANHVRIFYAHRPGTGEGLNLVLVHGAGGSHLDWPAQLRRLPGAAAYALDLPGHGRSPKPGRTTIEAYADDVLAFIDALELDQVVLVGHSMGGAIAQTIGLRHPPALAGLVLVSTGARLRVAEAILGQIWPNFKAAVSAIIEGEWAPQTPAELVDAGRQLLLQTDPGVLHGDYLACQNFDVMDQLEQIRLPTLVISGTADRMTPAKYGRYLADHIPQAQFVAIEGGGHMVALEQPQPVAAAVARFLADR